MISKVIVNTILPKLHKALLYFQFTSNASNVFNLVCQLILIIILWRIQYSVNYWIFGIQYFMYSWDTKGEGRKNYSFFFLKICISITNWFLVQCKDKYSTFCAINLLFHLLAHFVQACFYSTFSSIFTCTLRRKRTSINYS